jgi:hypothetical protein
MMYLFVSMVQQLFFDKFDLFFFCNINNMIVIILLKSFMLVFMLIYIAECPYLTYICYVLFRNEGRREKLYSSYESIVEWAIVFRNDVGLQNRKERRTIMFDFAQRGKKTFLSCRALRP